jgi:UrcA family protein
MKNFVIASLIVTASAIASFAFADQPQTTVVNYADLDVNQTQGAAILYGRIVSAAHRVCSPFEPSDRAFQFRMKALYDSCVTKALTDAVTKVNQPALTEYAMNKGGRPAVKLAAR